MSETKQELKSLVPLMFTAILLVGCAIPALPPEHKRVPALEYSRIVQRPGGAAHAGRATQVAGFGSPQKGPQARAHMARAEQDGGVRARLHYVKDFPPEERSYMRGYKDEAVTNLADEQDQGYEIYRSNRPQLEPEYQSALGLGNPGVSASLWHESRAKNDLFRDHRAFQPMDLITIVVTENSEGKKEADTEVETQSSLLYGIANFFGFENDIESSNSGIDSSSLASVSSENQFEAEGETTRKGSLKARLSAMVVEVLPSGILRIEGEKIISVNNEEQVMVISGLVRVRDISAANEVDSSKLANLRVDYFGRGTIGEAQKGGIGSRLFRRFWPF